MNKLLSMFLVLVIATAALAVEAPVWMQVDPLDQRPSYMPSEIITIWVATEAQVIGLDLAAISDNGAGGMAEHPLVLSPSFGAFADPGELVNDGGILVKWIAGNAGAGVSATGMLYAFEYHVPDVPESTLISIGSFDGPPYWMPLIDFLGGSSYEGPLGELIIHVVPEPATIALLGLGGLFFARRRK